MFRNPFKNKDREEKEESKEKIQTVIHDSKGDFFAGILGFSSNPLIRGVVEAAVKVGVKCVMAGV